MYPGLPVPAARLSPGPSVTAAAGPGSAADPAVPGERVTVRPVPLAMGYWRGPLPASGSAVSPRR